MSELDVKSKPAASPEPEEDVAVDSMETDIEEEHVHVSNTVIRLFVA